MISDLMNRRKFLGLAAGATAATVMPGGLEHALAAETNKTPPTFENGKSYDLKGKIVKVAQGKRYGQTSDSSLDYGLHPYTALAVECQTIVGGKPYLFIAHIGSTKKAQEWYGKYKEGDEVTFTGKYNGENKSPSETFDPAKTLSERLKRVLFTPEPFEGKTVLKFTNVYTDPQKLGPQQQEVPGRNDPNIYAASLKQ